MAQRWNAAGSGVAGVSAPAFVERTRSRLGYLTICYACVAGVSAPAFVERATPHGA